MLKVKIHKKSEQEGLERSVFGPMPVDYRRWIIDLSGVAMSTLIVLSLLSTICRHTSLAWEH